MAGESRSSAALYLLAALTLPLGAQAQEIRLGAEFQVHSYTTNAQHSASVAASANGDFVVAWQSDSGQDGSSSGVFARRFSRAGQALATAFQVNSYSTGSQGNPAVAVAAGGDFIIAWESDGQDGDEEGIFVRRFSSAGSALASELQINTYTNVAQILPAVAAFANGDFLVAWQRNAFSPSPFNPSLIFARRFSSAGSALADEFQVSSYFYLVGSNTTEPAIAANASGAFVVAWTTTYSDGSLSAVHARRFSSAGSALATAFQVNTYTANSQDDPAVAASADGGFAVVWSSIGQDGSGRGIFARRFPEGEAPVSEFQVNSPTLNNQFYPAVAASADGDFVVAWSSDHDPSSLDIFARRFSSAGSALATEFRVNTYITGSQLLPEVAVSGDRFVVAWTNPNQDGSSYGVFAQRFAIPISLDVDGNGDVDPLTDVLLALRYVSGFRGAVLVNGVVDLVGCTRCDAPSIEAYLNGLTHLL